MSIAPTVVVIVNNNCQQPVRAQVHLLPLPVRRMQARPTGALSRRFGAGGVNF